MKNRKLAATILGIVLGFSLCVTGCAGKAPDKENSAANPEQEGTQSESAKQDSVNQQADDSMAADTQKADSEAQGNQPENENPFSSLNEFQALALDGSTVTQDNFADKDITVINFWALSCGPCLAEMPDLAALEKALPDNIQLMTVCLDGNGNEEYVKYVLDQTGFEGTTLLAGDGDLLTLCQELQYTPTTVLVDSEGNTVGEAIIGGKENLAEFYTACINRTLTDMGKDEISIDTESDT
ncbi:MAG TPA: hypothetical protein DCZ91_22415 [Lachnospiraceae bacterium]|nr:hypothetical protein [Lachnospiraceae bacterium]